MERSRIHSRNVIILLVLMIFIFLIGFFIGGYVTTKAVVSVASNFIDIDYSAVNAALYQYKNNINHCYKKDEILQNFTS